MASNRHATSAINQRMFIYILVSLLLPTVHESVTEDAMLNDDSDLKMTREYHLRQGALRGFVVKPGRSYDLQEVEIFMGIPYAAPPVGNLRFMPPVSASPWPNVKLATKFAPVCPQSLPVIKKGNPPSLGRQHYLNRLKPFLTKESEDCLYLNVYVPHREQKSKKFPVLVFIHGDSFEWSSGNPYDSRVLASYGNIMVITINFRLGILGFMKPSLTEHFYGNNGLLDQLAALQWIKDNIEDLNGDPGSVTLMGHGTGAACVNFLMLSPISNGLFHRAILMSGSALSDWAMTKDPAQYTLQVAQSLGCKPSSRDMMTCLQNKPLSEIKKVQILAREFETPLGPIVAGSFIPSEPAQIMESYSNLLTRYQVLCGVTELESYHEFGVIELDHGILENQRDDFIHKYIKILFDAAEDVALKEILKQYSPSKLDPQRWNVDINREVILNLFSDARTLAPLVHFTRYHSEANRQSYFYVFGHNSVSTDYAALNKSVHGEELPYVFGMPLGGTNTHFHTEYTLKEKLFSEVIMRLWSNFVKNRSPNTQSISKYYTLDKKQWSQFNVEWPEYNNDHQSYLKLDIPPYVNSMYRTNFTNFWIDTLPKKMKKYIIDPLFEYTRPVTTQKPKSTSTAIDSIRRITSQRGVDFSSGGYNAPAFGKLRPYSQPNINTDTEYLYKEIQSIKTPSHHVPPESTGKKYMETSTTKSKSENNFPVKTSSATVTLIVSVGILFFFINIGICTILFMKKRKLKNRERAFQINRHSRAEIGEVDVIGQKSAKENKKALKTLKNGCNVIKSMSISKIRSGSIKSKRNKNDFCKTPKSDDSGGFRERFQLRRHLSTSTLDAHTKVRDWIANEVIHRCSPSILRKSNSDLDNDGHNAKTKPFTRSEELLSDSKTKNDTLKVQGDLHTIVTVSTKNNKNYNSGKTTSTSALGSHSSVVSNKHSSINSKQKSTDSIISKGTESTKSKKVSVAVDATPAARTNSILSQEPIELTKSFENNAQIHSGIINKLQRSKTDDNLKHDINEPVILKRDKEMTFTNVVTLSLEQNKKPLIISHKHSVSDPVSDINYEKMLTENAKCINQVTNVLPPVSFRNDINVTSREENKSPKTMNAAEALLTIQRRNFPKVLPDLPKLQKRLSLQPTVLRTFRSFGESIEGNTERSKVPPQPPPRTTTLERRLAYKNSKYMTSFDIKNKNNKNNYENYDNLQNIFDKNPLQFDKNISNVRMPEEREYPRVVIASSNSPGNPEPKIIITPTSSNIDIHPNAPRVRLPDDFHSQTSGSVTSFSSFYSDDEDDAIEIDDEILDELTEDKLIRELVGGVNSPTNLEDILDSKGPETIFEKKLEIVPVKIKSNNPLPYSKTNFVAISDLLLPDITSLDRTAQIKPNLGMSKLAHRSESIHKPPEKTVKLKEKRILKPLLNKSTKKRNQSLKTDSSNLEHSYSGSSNDTETSTGTVKRIDHTTS